MKETAIVFNSNNNAGLPRARARYLTQAIALEEEGPSGTIRAAIFFSLVFFGAMVYWASITKVAEVTVSIGEVLPAGLIHNIQHLEGGIVETLHVKNGDTISQGDILLSLSPQATVSDLHKKEIRELTLKLQIERLQSLIEVREPNFLKITSAQHSLTLRQQNIYESELVAQQNARKTINQQIISKQSELVRNTNQIKSIKQEIKLLAEQVKIRKQLSSKGLVARTELLSTQSKQLESMRKLRDLEDGSSFAKSAIEEKIRQRSELISNFIRDKQLESGTLLNQLAEVEQELIRLKDRVNRLRIVSPVNGIIQALTITSINEVIEPGKVIMRIVPVDDELIIEAKVPPDEIGYIRKGQPTAVKVDSYDSSRFGSVNGTVKQISASTYLDDQREPYYRAEIQLDQHYVGSNPEKLKIIPGMTVQTDIKIGSKTLLDYILRPISRGFDSAFHER